MIPFLNGLNEIAKQRGDGLRPELLTLVERERIRVRRQCGAGPSTDAQFLLDQLNRNRE